MVEKWVRAQYTTIMTCSSFLTTGQADFSFHYSSIYNQKGLANLHEKNIMSNSVHSIEFIRHV